MGARRRRARGRPDRAFGIAFPIDTSHDRVDIRLDDGDVGERVTLHGTSDECLGRGAAPVEAQSLDVPLTALEVGAFDLHVFIRVGQRDDQRAVRPVFFAQPGDRPVEDDGAVVDQDHAAREPFDVGEVVGGEDNGGAALTIELRDELADRFLGDDVEADGRLVEVDDLWIVEHRGRKVAAHPFAE